MAAYEDNQNWAIQFLPKFQEYSPELAEELKNFLLDFESWTRAIADLEAVGFEPGATTVVFREDDTSDLVAKAKGVLGRYLDTVESAWRWVAEKMSPTKHASAGLDKLKNQIQNITGTAIEQVERLAAIPGTEIGNLIETVSEAQANVIESVEELVEELGEAAPKIGKGFATGLAPVLVIAGGGLAGWFFLTRKRRRA